MISKSKKSAKAAKQPGKPAGKTIAPKGARRDAAHAAADARVALLSEASQVGFFELHVADGDMASPRTRIEISPVYRRMIGVGLHDAVTIPQLTSTIHPADLEAVTGAFAAHLDDRSGRTPYRCEYRARTAGGTDYRWFRSSAATTRDAAGAPVLCAGSMQDIHEEKQQTEALNVALSRNELINRASGVALWDMTVIAGDPINPKNEFWWSQQFRHMLGFRDEHDFPNVLDAWASRLHADDKDRILTAFAAHLNDHSGKTPYDVEYQLQLKTGEYRWFRATGATNRDDHGVPLRVAGALKNIHEDKQTELALQDALTRNDLINLASGVALWDMSVIAGDPINPKNEFWWSQQFRQMLGFRDEHDFPNVLDAWASRLHPRDKDRVLNAFGAHLNDHSGKTPYDIEYQLQLKNGDWRWFRATGATKRDAKGIPLRVAGALKDIHDEKGTVIALESLIEAAVGGDLTQRLQTDKYEGASRTIGDAMNRLLD